MSGPLLRPEPFTGYRQDMPTQTARETDFPDSHLLAAAQELIRHGGLAARCELVADKDDAEGNDRGRIPQRENAGRCSRASAGFRFEDGFGDSVCQAHGERAEARGVLVIWSVDE